jgi:hypothetical protein
MLRRAVLVAIVAACCFPSSNLLGVPIPPLEGQPKPKRTVIPGTWTWAIQTNKLGDKRSDLWWCHQTETEWYLVPRNGAALKVLTTPFEKVDLNYLKAVKYSQERVPGSDNNNVLLPGTVLAVRTANGDFAKLKVIRYYKLHDFTFPGSEVLKDQWKLFTLQRPDRDFYNIEVEWIFYKSK